MVEICRECSDHPLYSDRGRTKEKLAGQGSLLALLKVETSLLEMQKTALLEKER